MATISDLVNQIKNAIFGKDVRSAIADGIQAISDKADNNLVTAQNTADNAVNIANDAKAKVEANDNRIDNLVNAPEGKDLEVQDLKFDEVNNIQYNSAGERVNAINSALNDMAYYAKTANLKGDGTTDDYIALNALLNTIGSNNRKISFSSGVYLINTNIIIPANVTLIFEKGAVLKCGSNITITIQGSLKAGMYQIFDTNTSGVINLLNAQIEYACAEWFGALNNSDADITTAAFIALAASKAQVIKGQQNAIYLINEAVTFNPITENYGKVGRIFDMNKSTVKAMQKNGVSPTNVFIFTSSSWPSNMWNTNIRNIFFDGTVTGSFLKLKGSTVYSCTVENIHSQTSAYGNALVEFNSDVAGANSGLNKVSNIYPATHIKYGLLFSAETGADGQFDDMIIEQVSSVYMDGTDGSTIKLNDNIYLVYSSISTIYMGGKGYAIRGGTNTYIQDCNIKNVYMEPKSASTIALYTNFLRCKVDIIHMKFDTTVTTFARMLYGLAVNCTFTNFYQTNNSGVQVTGLYCEEIGACLNNTYKNIGYGSPQTYIKLVSTTATSKIEDYYGDPFIYSQVGTLQTFSDGLAHSNVKLMDIPSTEITDNVMLRFKVRGSNTASANNRFAIKLIGSGIDITLLNFAVDTAGQWEVDFDIIRRSSTLFAYYCKGFIGTIMSSAYGGTPELASLTIPSDLQLVINVTNCAYISVGEVNCLRAKAVIKPI